MLGIDLTLVVGAIAFFLNAMAVAIAATRGEMLIDANIRLGVSKNGTSINKIDGVLDPPKATGKT